MSGQAVRRRPDGSREFGYWAPGKSDRIHWGRLARLRAWLDSVRPARTGGR